MTPVDLVPALAGGDTAIAALVGAWRDDTYTRYLARTAAPRDRTEREFANLRDAHGGCTADSFVHEGFDWRAELACERGGGLVLDLAVRPDGAVASYRFHAPLGCPTR